ncbi:MAG TPA: DUF4270 domain-containing protein [Daejeonella sp.]|nr:DUF4270 domain-containing protein [Daejeonella sp.]
MKLLKQDLLTLLISLFILSGCKNPTGIGLDVDPANAINGQLVESKVESFTVSEEIVPTGSLDKYPVGYWNDPVYGKTQSSLSLSLNIPAEGVTFGTNPTLDSAVLVLKYANEYAGDPNAKLKFEVYQLQDRLDSKSNYFNNASHSFRPTLLGSLLTQVNIKDSISVVNIIKGKPDEIKKLPAHIRIPINADFIRNQFLNAASSNFSDNETFQNFIKGLYVTVNPVGTTGAGGVALLDLSTADISGLTIYSKSANGTAIDTTVTALNIRRGSAPLAATFNHDYTGTDVQTQLNNPTNQYNFTYVQPMNGVRTRINFPELDKLKALGNIIINKAELVATVQGGTDIFTPSARLFLYRTDIADQRQLIPDVSNRDSRALSDLEFGGFYDSTLKRYKFNITAYIQDLLNGRLQQHQTYIAAVDPQADRNTALFPSGATASRVVIGSGSSTADPTFRMKLSIIYTKVN